MINIPKRNRRFRVGDTVYWCNSAKMLSGTVTEVHPCGLVTDNGYVHRDYVSKNPDVVRLAAIDYCYAQQCHWGSLKNAATFRGFDA